MPTLQFLGATGTVTGSKYALEANGERLMIDCGLFQGEKELRLRNWGPLAVPPSSFRWLALTRALPIHVDSPMAMRFWPLLGSSGPTGYG